MIDLTQTIAPKSDQWNADDLLSGPRTIRITQVTLVAGEQPCAINFENDEGRVWRPGKSMRRVLVHVWGKDANVYIGRSLTMYCDPAVKFGGMEVGGIRISHMSHIDKPVTMALTATRANRKPFTVRPLAVAEPEPAKRTARDFLNEARAALASAMDGGAVDAIIARDDVQRALDKLPPALKAELEAMIKTAIDRTTVGTADEATEMENA